MPALKQTLYVEFDINESKHLDPFNIIGTTFARTLFLSFVPDYMRVKQLTHFSAIGDNNIYYISSSLLPDQNVFSVIVGNYNNQPDLFFPINKSVNSSFDFTIRSKGDGVAQQGMIIMALEFTKELGYQRSSAPLGYGKH